MIPLLSVRDLSRQFDVEPVFRHVSFEVRAGEKIGLVGPNGCGKTTLLHILAGVDEPDVGAVERHPSVTVGLLEQEAEFASDRTLREEVQSGLDHLYRLQAEAHDIAERMAATTDETELGITYADIDDYLEGRDVTADIAEKIETRYRQTEHKRRVPVTPFDTWWR